MTSDDGYNSRLEGDPPFRETPASGPTCTQCGRVHPRGRFLPGCPGPRLQHGLHSKLVQAGHLPSQREAAAALAAKQAQIEADLGGTEALSQVHRDAIGDLLRLELIAGYLFDRLLEGGPLTGRGRTRAATTAYLQVLDRVVRLRQLVGLARRPRQIADPIADFERRAMQAAAEDGYDEEL